MVLCWMWNTVKGCPDRGSVHGEKTTQMPSNGVMTIKQEPSVPGSMIFAWTLKVTNLLSAHTRRVRPTNSGNVMETRSATGSRGTWFLTCLRKKRDRQCIPIRSTVERISAGLTSWLKRKGSSTSSESGNPFCTLSTVPRLDFRTSLVEFV